MFEKSTRRQFLYSTTQSAFAAPFIMTRHRKDKPNLLFLWTDEQRADTMAVYGNHTIHSPNLNTLASESVVFEKAYVSQPVCTPSRSTVLTGLWPHTNSCVENNIPLPQSVPCLPELIGDPDYRTAYMGKWHLGDEIFAQHGFQEWIAIEDGYRRYYREGRDKNAKSDYWSFLNDLGYEPNTDDGYYSRSFAARRPLEHCKPKFLEQKACDFLERHRDEPFLLHINFLEPHMPFFGPLDDEHHPTEIDLPENFNDPLEANEPLRYRLLRERYRQRGFEGHDLKKENGWRRLIANYWGLVSQVDLSVGAILTQLEKLGLSDNTIVVYTSDHGDMMGSHQLLAKTVMYEESVRVPWLMRIPQQGRKQQLIHDRVSHIDLVPTLMDLMGKPVPDSLSGHSLIPYLKGGPFPNDHVFIEWNPSGRRNAPNSIPKISENAVENAGNASIRTVLSPDGWKLCWSDLDHSQLFDLNTDPYETTNQYDKSEHKQTIKHLEQKIREWQESSQDTVSFL